LLWLGELTAAVAEVEASVPISVLISMLVSSVLSAPLVELAVGGSDDVPAYVVPDWAVGAAAEATAEAEAGAETAAC
jgi:hypothetical protein